MADQNITALPVAASPASSDQLLLVGATEEKLIDYDKLADAILTKLTSKQYTLDQGTKTLPAALNELNSNRLTDVTKLLETPTEFMSNVSDSDHTLCLRNGKTVTFVINVKILKPLSAFTTYLTLPEQYIPASVIFVPIMTIDTGLRIGTSGEVMPCANIDAGTYIQTAISYVIK